MHQEEIPVEITAHKKIVLMSLANSGKTTLCKKFLNEKWIPVKSEYMKLPIGYETHQRIIHNTEFTVFNLGGQTTFLDQFLGELKGEIFGQIDTLVFLVDSIQIPQLSRAKHYFDLALEQVKMNNSNASVFLLLNKTDLLPRMFKEEVVGTLKRYLLKNVAREIRVFETSIFDNTSTKAIEEVYRANIRIFEEKIPMERGVTDEVEEETDELLSASIQEALARLTTDKDDPDFKQTIERDNDWKAR